ncbi:uncharacterized protein LOC105166222 isoform X2 [Sesamum indicum]|uniref:Gamma-tubulin complex component n=1 Tax=Sesamum indicum TaxID=4182 RepID=A0A6I9TI78_SESIN|nr:uncharacterized protein LOC105166222 isoform X2 [Sesamum indicum]
MEVAESLIHKIHSSFTGGGIHFATPVSSLRTNELDLVRGVLQMLQGLSSSLFYWDDRVQCFHFKNGIYVTHLSQTSLYRILDQFSYAATCLQLVDIVVNKIEKSKSLPPPTLKAFACSVSTWLRRIRDVALKEEVKVNSSNGSTTPSILGLSSSLSRLCSQAEYLFQIVHGAIPQLYFERESYFPAADIAVHILNHLYVKLNEVCLVQGGEEDAYRMLLYILVGSLLPYIEILDCWLFQGTLDDPFDEMFFVANKKIAIDEAEFWEKSYQLRSAMPEKLNFADFASDFLPSAKEKKDVIGRVSISLSSFPGGKEENKRDFQVCPFFIKDIAKAIISAGKSLQLIRHAPITSLSADSTDDVGNGYSIAGLTLSEVFCVSLTALIGHGDHVAEYLWKNDKHSLGSIKECQEQEEIDVAANKQPKLFWQKLLDDTLAQKRDSSFVSSLREGATNYHNLNGRRIYLDEIDIVRQTHCPENPAINVCHGILQENREAWSSLNISQSFYLPPLNDEWLRQAIFSDKCAHGLTVKNTDYTSGFHSELENLRFREDAKMLEVLLPFPTLLPSFQEDLQMSEVLPFQINCTLSSKILSWIQNVEPKSTPPPAVILQECLIFYIKKQADYIGRTMLSKLLNDWRLLDELAVLRAIYLLGSGDLLQHFLSVIFNKLDKEESLDDDFELNTILQESIRNSADNVLLSTPDSLVVSVAKNLGFNEDEQYSPSISVSTPRKGRGQSSMDVLDSLTFTYKVSWPLELIANLEAMKKYNQVMSFLLKVKRAKFVLDKARRWMWKGRGTITMKQKRHWLLEQKLLHFVDAFHQYVMDRVYHNAWRELCEGVAAAGTLDEAIEVHEAYLLSIQRQCFVVPDKLWGLIASRINSILGLALDFYSIQQTLSSGGAISAVKARCGKEVERIEKQFDDCMAFLLRVFFCHDSLELRFYLSSSM